MPLAVVAVETDGVTLYRVVSTETPDEATARALVERARLAGVLGAWYWREGPPAPAVAPTADDETPPSVAERADPHGPADASEPTGVPEAPRAAQETPPASRREPWIDYWAFSGDVSLEGRWHPNPPLHPGQRAHANGLVLRPELYLEDRAGRSLTVAPFFRYDAADPDRTHGDLHKAYVLLLGMVGGASEWELRLGVDRVFWGVTESQHLVDIVNQVDLVEHPNEKARLGQFMAHATLSGDWGAFELFGITGHRARTFSGRAGRLRLPLLIDQDAPVYESGAGEWHMDVAARYTRSIGLLDVGLSVFDGTAREPFLLPVLDARAGPVLHPYYRKIGQFGLDAQLTAGAGLYKLEAIRRSGAYNLLGREEDYTAFVVGGEYTLYGLFGSAVDLGLLAEWNYDGRRQRATSRFQNDLFFGTRVALNDAEGTELILGALTDRDHDSQFVSLEINRRLWGNWSLRFETVLLRNVGTTDLLHALRDDSFVGLDLVYSF